MMNSTDAALAYASVAQKLFVSPPFILFVAHISYKTLKWLIPVSVNSFETLLNLS